MIQLTFCAEAFAHSAPPALSGKMARTIAEVAAAANPPRGGAIGPDETQEPPAKRKRASRLDVAIKAVETHQAPAVLATVE